MIGDFFAFWVFFVGLLFTWVAISLLFKKKAELETYTMLAIGATNLVAGILLYNG